MRDSQRSRVYRGECELMKREQRRFDHVAEAQAYARRVLKSPWLRRQWSIHYPGVVCEAKHHGRATAHWRHGLIRLPVWALKEAVVLHELAHLIAPGDGHGRHFARVFLMLVRHFMGVEAFTVLRDGFKRQKVKYSKPRRLTPERRAALVAQLAAARKQLGVAASREPTP